MYVVTDMLQSISDLRGTKNILQESSRNLFEGPPNHVS